ncbi:MAG TPA: tetratricopeptide repeat protein [Flavobacteriales bacterium]|nr:tetratricopeptide repeat protein [Flavobacteriales bacterium]
MKSILRIFALLVCTISVQAQTLDEAKRLTLNEQYEAASSVFNQLIAKFPNKGDYWFYYGENLLKADKADSAKAIYTLGIQNEPTNPLNFVGLGKISKIEGNKDQATQQFEKAIKMGAGKNAEVLIRTAEASISIDPKDLTQAFALLKEAEKLQLRNPEIQILNGDAFLENNDGSSAIKFYERAQELDPKSPLAMLRLGQLWVRARNYVGKDGSKGALEYYNDAIKIDPSFAPAYRELGELFAKAQRYEEAKQNYAKYLELSKGTQGSRVRYASFLYATKDYKEALNVINDIWKTDTTRVLLYRLAAYSSYETKDFVNGMVYIRKFLERQPESRLIAKDYAYFGRLLSANGQDSLALENLNKSYSQDTAAHDLLGDIANIYTKLKRYPEAAAAYNKKIILTKPASKDYHLLGITYYKMNEFGKADTAFTKVNELSPKFVQGFDWRGRAQSSLDPESKAGLAKASYEQVVLLGEADSTKYQKELMSAYRYLGYFYYLNKDYTNSRIWWEKVKAIDPLDKQANDALTDMKGK